ncbi:MAG: serine/threonine-protein kinase [Pseudonocardiaceae bacterium]
MAGWSVPGVVHPREVREDPVGRRMVARHRITRTSLAITYLSPELCADTEFRARFASDFSRLARVREARVHRYLECDHGAAVIGDQVSGTSLRALLLAHGALSTAAGLVVFKDTLLALAACHDAGLAHGDVKPEDVILTPAGRVRLVDFGLWTFGGRRLLARSTPFYLAPEQGSDRPASPAGDVYAATVTFFECLVGAPPFHGGSVAELSVKHEHDTPQLEVIPEPVRKLVLCGLAKDPRSRPEARRLLAEVDDVAARMVGSGWEQRGRRELATLLANRPVVPRVFESPRRSGGWAYRKPVRLAAVMGGALALAAGLSSPPLAVIFPGASIVDSWGRSPVLAFPEPDHDTVPVRVVTNGPLADRALMPAAKAGVVRPSAPSITVPKSQAILAGPQVFQPGSTHPDGAAHGLFTPDRVTPAPPACTQQLMSAHKPCTAVNPEQPAPGSVGTTSDPSQVSIPVDVLVHLNQQVHQPVPVRLLVQVPVPSVTLVPKSGLQQDMRYPRDHVQTDSPAWEVKEWTRSKDTPARSYEQPTNWPQGSSGNGSAESR